MVDLSDTLTSLKSGNKAFLAQLALERQGLEMQLSLFSKPPLLRPGDRSGYLWKHGNLLKEWKRRFFFTKNHSLWYYRGSEAIKYSDLTLSKAAENKNSEWNFAISMISANRTIELLAESQWGVEEWVHTLNALAEATLMGSSGEDIRCADCTSKCAQWCSLNLFVMLCSDCSGVHRSLGSHISRVRSWTMDYLRPSTRELVTIIHKRQEELWGVTVKVSAIAGFPEREAFIRQKYIQKTGFRLVTDPIRGLSTAISSIDLISAAKSVHSGVDLTSKSVSFLHLAVAARSKLMLELLLLSGGDVNARDAQGLTVLDAALLTQETELVTFLLESLDSK